MRDTRSTTSSILQHVSMLAKLVDSDNLTCNVNCSPGLREVIVPFSIVRGESHKVFDRVALVVENLTDGDVCKLAMEVYLERSGIAGVPFSARVENGGGSTTTHVFSRQAEYGHFVMCVVDSDRRFPGDKLGDTAKLVKRAERRLDGRCLVHVMPVRSAENLFGHSGIGAFVNQPDSRVDEIRKAVLSVVSRFGIESTDYICVKSGLSCYDVSCGERWKYWGGVFGGVQGGCGGIRACDQRSDCSAVVVSGFGDASLQSAVTFWKNDGVRLMITLMEDRHVGLLSDLGREVFSWCCGGERKPL